MWLLSVQGVGRGRGGLPKHSPTSPRPPEKASAEKWGEWPVSDKPCQRNVAALFEYHKQSAVVRGRSASGFWPRKPALPCALWSLSHLALTPMHQAGFDPEQFFTLTGHNSSTVFNTAVSWTAWVWIRGPLYTRNFFPNKYVLRYTTTCDWLSPLRYKGQVIRSYADFPV